MDASAPALSVKVAITCASGTARPAVVAIGTTLTLSDD